MELLTLLIASYLLASSAVTDTATAVEYMTTNKAVGTPGGKRFDKDIGLDYTKQLLAAASSFTWTILEQESQEDRKNVQLVFIETMDGLAYTTHKHTLDRYEIHVSASYIAKYAGDVKKKIAGVLYHEMVHVWQWHGNETAPAPVGLTEGIADFVSLKAGYIDSSWVKPGEGNWWALGCSVTARFLDYCNGLKSGFVAELNAKMKNGYSGHFFVQLLGKTVDQLWRIWGMRSYTLWYATSQ